jgi:hypothetical protein
MTSRDLFDNVPLRDDYGKVDALAQGRCGHCGEPMDFHMLSYFCKRCYDLMHIGDTVTLVGLADDINDIERGNVAKEAYNLPERKFKVIDEG